jgi:hypothetical protein
VATRLALTKQPFKYFLYGQKFESNYDQWYGTARTESDSFFSNQ